MSDSSLSTWGWLRSPSYILLLSPFWYCCMWQTLRPRTQLTPPPPRGPEPLAHRHFTSKLISGLVQMIKQRASGASALLTHEMRITAARGGTASPIRKGRVWMLGIFASKPSRRRCAWTWQSLSLLWAKVWGQFFCNRYTDRTFSSAHVCSNDHLWWAVTAVSLWCWALIGCICCRGVETFWFGQTVTQWALNWPWTKHEGKHITWSAHAWAFLIHYRDVPIWNTIKLKMSLNLH